MQDPENHEATGGVLGRRRPFSACGSSRGKSKRVMLFRCVVEAARVVANGQDAARADLGLSALHVKAGKDTAVGTTAAAAICWCHPQIEVVRQSLPSCLQAVDVDRRWGL